MALAREILRASATEARVGGRTLNCKGVVRQLSEYLNGALDPGLAEELQKHLEHCEDCHLVVDTCRKTIQIYCNTEPMALPAGVRERLERALAEKIGRQGR